MRHSVTTGGRLLAAASAACACVALTACGGASPGTTPVNAQTTPPISSGQQKLCTEIQAALSSLSGTNPSQSMSLPKAKKTLDTLLNNGIKAFTKLEPQAPADLRSAIVKIVQDFQQYEITANKAKTTKQLLNSSVTASPEQKKAFQELIGYTGTSC
jgi:hypothetical protein